MFDVYATAFLHTGCYAPGFKNGLGIVTTTKDSIFSPYHYPTIADGHDRMVVGFSTYHH